MAENKDIQPEDRVQLLGHPPGNEPVEGLYRVISVDKSSIRVKDKDGQNMMIHRSRVSKVVKSDQAKTPASPVPAPKKEEKPVPDTIIPTTTPKPEVKQEETFKVSAWVAEHGGVHYTKQFSFDHSGYKTIAHLCIDEKGGFYYQLNTYLDSKTNKLRAVKPGATQQFALKGKQVVKMVTTKKGTAKRTNKGKLTVEQLIAKITKSGYKHVAAPAPAAVTAPEPATAQ